MYSSFHAAQVETGQMNKENVQRSFRSITGVGWPELDEAIPIFPCRSSGN